MNIWQVLPWQVGVLISGVLSAVAQAIGKRQVTKMSAFQSGLLRDLTILVIIAGVLLVGGGGEWSWVSVSFVVVGLAESVMQGAYYSATREEMAGTVIFSYPLSGLLIVMMSGVLFGEWQYFKLSSIQGLSNVVALILMLMLVVIYQEKGVKRRRWSVKLLLSAMMVVVANLAQKWAVAVVGLRPASYMIYEYLGLVVGGGVLVYGRGLDLRVGWSQVKWGMVQGGLFAMSILWYVTILVEHPLSLASMIRRVVIVTIAAGSGLWIFGERKQMNVRKWVSLGLGMVILVTMMWVNR